MNISKYCFPKCVLMAALLVFCHACGSTSQMGEAEQAAYGVISRTLGYSPRNIVLEIAEVPAAPSTGSGAIAAEGTIAVEGTGPAEWFSTEVKGGKLYVKGTSTIALCRGFYDFVTSNGLGLCTWEVNNIRFHKRLKDSQLKRVETPFARRQWLNVCTHGYTMPFWNEEQWLKELDRMALHGINMMLSPFGTDAVFERVWKQLGLTDDEINAAVTGPAHFPWYRLGNMTGLDGGLSPEFYAQSIAIGHSVMDRMKSLGITPICYAFSGFVPEGISRLYPDVQLTGSGWNDGPMYHSKFLSPGTELFKKIAAMYLTEWEKEFGKCDYYIASSFGEMDVPFAPQGTYQRLEQLHDYGRTMYSSILSAAPHATWVLQDWMFGYRRGIWDPESVRAFLSGIPDDNFLLIDLAVDYNVDIWQNTCTWEYAPAMYGKEWIWSTVPNFGGRTAPVAKLDFYLNGHLDALASPLRGRLTGYGAAPEGVENNEVVYELMADAAWSTTRKDIRQWLRNYSINRYGSCPQSLMDFWNGMLDTGYGYTSSQAVYRVQRQPFFTRGSGIDLSDRHFEAIESFIQASDSLASNKEYLADLAAWSALYAFGKADILLEDIYSKLQEGDSAAVLNNEDRFIALLDKADRFLESHPVLRLERWISQARALGQSPAEKDAFETNARRIVTIWGPGRVHDGLDDYASKVWSGLIRDYYIPRWQNWFDAIKSGDVFDFDAWEWKFAEERKPLSEGKAFDDPVSEAKALVSDTKDLHKRYGGLCGWSRYELQHENKRLAYFTSPRDIDGVKALKFKYLSGKDNVTVKEIRLRGSNLIRMPWTKAGVTVGPDNPEATVPLTVTMSGNWKFNFLDIRLENRESADSNVRIEYVY
mgnify:CR=1 FL=1